MIGRRRYILLFLTLVLIFSSLVSNGCSLSHSEGFAIHLTGSDIPPSQMEGLGNVTIADQPVIAMRDIITYNTQTHELKLIPTAFERISQLDVPVRGKTFIVCIDKKPIYWGAFWTPISSISFDGVTIWKPFDSQEPKVITLELGYPSSSFYGGEDPRNNTEVLNVLRHAGKLITGLSITTITELPHSMAGYELYSWTEDGQWHFTLMTGTDRNKTLEEIISREDYISETGWEEIHVVGVDNIKAVFSKLPQGEEVYWLSAPRAIANVPENISFTLSLAQDKEIIRKYAAQYGVDLKILIP